MSECIDSQIITALINLLGTITTDNLYETDVNAVFIPKKVLKINPEQYPCILVYYNEGEPQSQGFEYRNDSLDVILVYSDGKDDETEDDSYIWRYRNVGADILKCVMSDPTLNGLCEMINVESQQPSLFVDGDLILEAHVTYLKVNRNINQFNPYL